MPMGHFEHAVSVDGSIRLNCELTNLLNALISGRWESDVDEIDLKPRQTAMRTKGHSKLNEFHQVAVKTWLLLGGILWIRRLTSWFYALTNCRVQLHVDEIDLKS